jgi:hypothetical protein
MVLRAQAPAADQLRNSQRERGDQQAEEGGTYRDCHE